MLLDVEWFWMLSYSQSSTNTNHPKRKKLKTNRQNLSLLLLFVFLRKFVHVLTHTNLTGSSLPTSSCLPCIRRLDLRCGVHAFQSPTHRSDCCLHDFVSTRLLCCFIRWIAVDDVGSFSSFENILLLFMKRRKKSKTSVLFSFVLTRIHKKSAKSV